MDYKKILKAKGVIHLKTDSEFLFGYTLANVSHLGKILYAHHNIYNNIDAPKESTAIQTFYEKKFLDQDKAITYIKFHL